MQGILSNIQYLFSESLFFFSVISDASLFLVVLLLEFLYVVEF